MQWNKIRVWLRSSLQFPTSQTSVIMRHMEWKLALSPKNVGQCVKYKLIQRFKDEDNISNFKTDFLNVYSFVHKTPDETSNN